MHITTHLHAGQAIPGPITHIDATATATADGTVHSYCGRVVEAHNAPGGHWLHTLVTYLPHTRQVSTPSSQDPPAPVSELPAAARVRERPAVPVHLKGDRTMRGTLTVLSALVDRGHPDVVRLLTDFVGRGTLLEQTPYRGWQTITYTLDHPDFDVDGGRYGLTVTTCIDPVHPLRQGFRLTKLQRLGTEGAPITVKEYP